ncbi:beta-galactosidase [Enterococcus sp. JM4C]|uniref:glycoside hydrolase family 35 protein n=1 Tax=Candidatus Enterococcus huntleyi TaxID=1857217 RepID=UPI00137AFA93|nr:beta-galactosidase family protein [Enterococcus sp. JM4C]KAF1295679.1 beta-galactosidase [Enterococcus sp. JM4C]
MTTFEIQEEFLLDGKPFKILSGAIHYFRIHPDDWYHSLYNLKALGFNTVETYIPWNIHEPQKGQFNFEGICSIENFLKTAQDLGLYAIVRPSPYICAEWEFGGLPAWLLNEPRIRLRSSDPSFLKHVADYYEVLLERLRPYQLSQGGNILMFQIENEYGSYGEDKEYLSSIKSLMEKSGITGPFFTSDGAWPATLRAGTIPEEDCLVTGNFGSKASENFAAMQKFMTDHQKKWPLMCMEFWNGWFNRWNEPIIRRDPRETAEEIKAVLQLGSINLYMFHGGTNFGFMNGCSVRGTTDLPQITSYDYDAPLDEQGNPTNKYFAIKDMLHEQFPELEQREPLIKSSIELKDIPLKNKVSLFSTVDQLVTPIHAKYPLTMEQLHQNTGYLLYQTLHTVDDVTENYRIIDASDRVQFYADGELISTQYHDEVGETITVNPTSNQSKIAILVENMGRVNYGAKLTADSQRKGIRTGVMCDIHFLTEWIHYPLALETSEKIDFSGDWVEKQPSFYQYQFTLEEVEDTFIDLSQFGKGCVFVNQQNIGRFWAVGPTLSLYIPKGLLKRGQNELIIFETEGVYQASISLTKQPVFKQIQINEEEQK